MRGRFRPSCPSPCPLWRRRGPARGTGPSHKLVVRDAGGAHPLPSGAPHDARLGLAINRAGHFLQECRLLHAECPCVSRPHPSVTGQCRGCFDRRRAFSQSSGQLQHRDHALVAVRDEPAWTPVSASAAGDSNRRRRVRAHARSQHFGARPCAPSPASLRSASMPAA